MQGGIEGAQSVSAKTKLDIKIRGGFNMFNTLKKRIKNEKGLSLVELLAVIVIMAIIAAIAIPAIGNIINNSRDKAILSEASNILAGAKLAHIDNKCGAPAAGVVTCNAAAIKGYVDGVDVTATDTAASATLGADGIWSISYAKFTKINGETYKVTSPVSESVLKSKLDK